MDDATYAAVLSKVKELGFDLDKVVRVEHTSAWDPTSSIIRRTRDMQ